MASTRNPIGWDRRFVVYCTPEEKERLEKEAAAERRTLSRHVLHKALARDSALVRDVELLKEHWQFEKDLYQKMHATQLENADLRRRCRVLEEEAYRPWLKPEVEPTRDPRLLDGLILMVLIPLRSGNEQLSLQQTEIMDRLAQGSSYDFFKLLESRLERLVQKGVLTRTVVGRGHTFAWSGIPDAEESP